MSFFFHKHDIVFEINKKDIIQVGRISNIFILFWLQGISAFYIKYMDKEHRVKKFTVVCGWLFSGVKADEEWISNFKKIGVNVK
ncbi:MAG: hypothetical protein G01um101431_61 [Parcubacteria group bacterium Gr01-1014_31]|nr:MAG: hypothetical protein G01um101431_61 [Parcubacteria group bacterium Gr01-1014_31]